MVGGFEAEYRKAEGGSFFGAEAVGDAAEVAQIA